MLSEDTRKSTEEYHSFFTQHGWNTDDYYFCAKVIPSSDLGFGNTLNICIQLEKLLKGSYAIQFQDHILYIVNLTYCKKTMAEALEILIPEFRDYLIKAGISLEFRDLLMLKDYYFQADTALTLGLRKDGYKWEYRFENYAMDYIASKIKEDISLRLFCHNSLLKLRDYDKKKGRNYYELLKVYLSNNMNGAKTIRQLYMQRQTFLYQLNKIYEITGLKLTNPKTRVYLQISFLLMENEEEGLNFAP